MHTGGVAKKKCRRGKTQPHTRAFVTVALVGVHALVQQLCNLFHIARARLHAQLPRRILHVHARVVPGQQRLEREHAGVSVELSPEWHFDVYIMIDPHHLVCVHN